MSLKEEGRSHEALMTCHGKERDSTAKEGNKERYPDKYGSGLE